VLNNLEYKSNGFQAGNYRLFNKTLQIDVNGGAKLYHLAGG